MASRKQTAGSAPATGPTRSRFSLASLTRRGGAPTAPGPAGRAAGKGRDTGRSGAGSRAVGGSDRRATRAAKKATRRERLTQLRTAFTMTRKADSRLVPVLIAAFLVPFLLLLALGIVIHHPFLLGFLGVMLGITALAAIFGRRAQGNAYRQVEGQAGAAAAVLSNMRGDWRVTPAVGYNREQDLVHRVVGRPGVVLVGEGSPQRTRSLLINEKRKLARFVGDVPVYDVVVGDAEGQVPLRSLEKHFVKLPRNVTPKDVNTLDRKLKAMAPALPIPKGPMPTGGRAPRGKMR